MSQLLTSPETALFYLGLLALVLASLVAWIAFFTSTRRDLMLIMLSIVSVAAFSLSIALRWNTTGSGPFLTLYEVLLSNLFSLGLIFTLVFIWITNARPAALLVLPFLSMMAFWAANEDTTALQLPATYNTVLLWLHVGVGKIFLGMCMVATALAGVLLIRHVSESRFFEFTPESHTLDSLAWRCMAIAFVFQSLMLIAGAAWAQDAWGRFWAWDSLETWAFITWLLLGLSMHARLTWKLPAWSGWLMIFVVFSLALLTFFGVPFSSIGPHRGIV